MPSVFYEESMNAIINRDYVTFKDNIVQVDDHLDRFNLLMGGVSYENFVVVEHIIKNITLSDDEIQSCLAMAANLSNLKILSKLIDLGLLPTEATSYQVVQYCELEPLKAYFSKTNDLGDPLKLIIFSMLNTEYPDVFPYVFEQFFKSVIFIDETEKEGFIKHVSLFGTVDMLEQISGTDDLVQGLKAVNKEKAVFSLGFSSCFATALTDNPREEVDRSIGFLDCRSFVEKTPDAGEFCDSILRNFMFNSRSHETLSRKQQELTDEGLLYQQALIDSGFVSLFQVQSVDNTKSSVLLIDLLDRQKEYEVFIDYQSLNLYDGNIVYSYLINFKDHYYFSGDCYPLPDHRKELILLKYKKEARKLEESLLARQRKKLKKGKRLKTKSSKISSAERYKILFHISLNQDWE